MTIGEHGRLDCQEYSRGEAFDEIAKLKKQFKVLEEKLVDAESNYDKLQSNISELQNLDVRTDSGSGILKSVLSKCEAPAFVEIAQRLAMIEGALKGMNEVDFGPELKDSEDKAAEAFGVDMSPEFAETFNELPKFNNLVDPGTTNEQDITVRYLQAKNMINADETLFDAIVGIVDELERERRIL